MPKPSSNHKHFLRAIEKKEWLIDHVPHMYLSLWPRGSVPPPPPNVRFFFEYTVVYASVQLWRAASSFCSSIKFRMQQHS